MPAPTSAGIAVRRSRGVAVEVLIGHLGGPLWARKDEGAWSFPKGLIEGVETPLEAARREFAEETGLPVPAGPLVDLGAVRTGGKTIRLWTLEADPDLSGFNPGTFELAWPPRSGRTITAPELDRIRWASLEDAERFLAKNQRPFVDRIRTLAIGAGQERSRDGA